MSHTHLTKLHPSWCALELLEIEYMANPLQLIVLFGNTVY